MMRSSNARLAMDDHQHEKTTDHCHRHCHSHRYACTTKADENQQ